MPVNILAMDGGGALSLVTLDLITRLERTRPGFLAAAQVFAGTSAGGINALLMTASEDRLLGLRRAVELWENNPFDTSLARVASAGLGCISVYNNHGFVQALEPVFGEMTLGELAARGGRVVIPSLQLKARTAQGALSWVPRVFQNLERTGQADNGELVLDVALRTSAAPVFLPVHQGFVDGGLFANNPSMCALSRALRGWQQDEIRLLSVGTGRGNSYLDAYDQPWGWGQWLFDCKRPLALMELFLSAGEQEIPRQCETILGQRFYRLNPTMRVEGAVVNLDLEDAFLKKNDPRFGKLKRVLRGFTKSSNPEWLDEVVAWLDAVDWMGSAGPETERRAAGPAVPQAGQAAPKGESAPQAEGAEQLSDKAEPDGEPPARPAGGAGQRRGKGGGGR